MEAESDTQLCVPSFPFKFRNSPLEFQDEKSLCTSRAEHLGQAAKKPELILLSCIEAFPEGLTYLPIIRENRSSVIQFVNQSNS